MKNFKFISALFVSVALLTSCEKAEIVPTKSSLTTTVVDTNFDDSFANRHSEKVDNKGNISTVVVVTTTPSQTEKPVKMIHVEKEALGLDK